MLVAGLCFFSAQAQYSMGTNTPNPSAILDLVSADRGFLAPRIFLTSINTFAPITGTASSAHNGLLVYNTNPSTANGLEGQGFYFWEGGSSGNWLKVADTANSTMGNIYTIDGALVGVRTLSQNNNNLTFNTGTGDFQVGNNNATLFVDGSTNRVGIGTNNPTESLHVSGNVRITGTLIDSSNDTGTAGQLLSSTGAGTNWVSGGGATIGDIKQGVQTADHGGWILLNGRNKSSLTASQRTQFEALFGASTTSLPQTSGNGSNNATYLADIDGNSSTVGSLGGNTDNLWNASDLPNLAHGHTATTDANSGGHRHSLRGSVADVGDNGNFILRADKEFTGNSSAMFASADGAHSHTITVNSANLGGSSNAVATNNRTLDVNTFLFLGN